MELNDRELATVLAALRAWQQHRYPEPVRDNNPEMVMAIATADGRFEPLSMKEIDGLCEYLNTQ